MPHGVTVASLVPLMLLVSGSCFDHMHLYKHHGGYFLYSLHRGSYIISPHQNCLPSAPPTILPASQLLPHYEEAA